MIRKLILSAAMIAAGLTTQAQIAQWAQAFRQMKGVSNAHSGICIYEPATGKYLYQYQDDKFFTPASNTKILTTYTALTLLGDSMTAFRYGMEGDTLFVQGSADPTFLHPAFEQQRAFEWLSKTNKHIALVPALNENLPFGPGWSWEDYDTDFQPERSEWPMYANVVNITYPIPNPKDPASCISPSFFGRSITLQVDNSHTKIEATRTWHSNQFFLRFPVWAAATLDVSVPYIMGNADDLRARLVDTLKRDITITPTRKLTNKFYSRPVDSILRRMMFESDDMLAEHTLMECSNELLDTISTAKVIDYMLAHSLKDLPQPPHWVDGSGLSRYNLFTPRDLVTVLKQMAASFPKKRLYGIFPTAGQGTLSNHYPGMAGAIYAKTGTFGNCFSLSGYLITKKGKTLIFSIMVNNHNDKSSTIRNAVEEFLTKVYENS